MTVEMQQATTLLEGPANAGQQPISLPKAAAGDDPRRDSEVHPGDRVALYILLACVVLIVAMNIWDFVVGMLSQ
jgi:hypothetical protein